MDALDVSVAADRVINVRARRVVAATLGLLVAGFVLQLLVYGHGGHTAISDLPRVFLHRGVRPDAPPYLVKVVEYPVGAGFLLYLAALVHPTPFGVLVVTALASSVLCVAITVALERRVGGRAWRWALGAPVMLYAFQNWDVFAVAAMLVGVLAYERRRDVTAGVALGVGAVIKLFPGVALPPLAARRWAAGDRRGAALLLGSAGAVVVASNLPVAVANPAGWQWPFAFQSARQATWGSTEFWLLRVFGAPVQGATGATLANALSFGALAVGLGGLTVLAWRRPLTAAGAAGAAVAIFLLVNKVYSPTYDLWLVVFFALLPIPRREWLAFCAVDVAMFATVYGYFHWGVSGATVHLVLPILVATRSVVLVLFVVRAVRVRAGIPAVGERVSAAPAGEGRSRRPAVLSPAR